MTRAPEPAMQAVYLDAAEAWLAAPDVRTGPFRADRFATLALADCGRNWLVWNTDTNGGRHPAGSLFVLMSKGQLEVLTIQVP